jgi:hypothetical protein
MSSARAAIVVMTLIYSVAAIAFSPGTSTHLRSDEYDAVALIYNSEIDALGQKALYPICISLPAGNSAKPLIQYLQRARYPLPLKYIQGGRVSSGTLPCSSGLRRIGRRRREQKLAHPGGER